MKYVLRWGDRKPHFRISIGKNRLYTLGLDLAVK